MPDLSLQLVESGAWVDVDDLLPAGADAGKYVSAVRRLAAQLRTQLKLRAEPFEFRSRHNGQMEMRTSGIAGSVSTLGVSIDIAPKFVFGESGRAGWEASMLMLMQHASRQHIAFSRSSRLSLSQTRVVDLLAMAYVEALKRAFATPLIQIYKIEEQSRQTLVGRLNVRRQVRGSIARPHLLECDVDRLDPRNEYNSVMKLAALKLSRMVHRADLRATLVDYYRKIPGDINPVRAKGDLERLLPAQYREWKDAIALAQLAASDFALSTERGNEVGFSFVFNMERLFERFIELRLVACVSMLGQQYEVSRQLSTLYASPFPPTEGRSFYSRPDNVIFCNRKPLVVVDAKYKRLSDNDGIARRKPTSSDVYELVAAITAQKCKIGLLVYPRISGDLDLEDGRMRIWSVTAEGRQILVAAVALDIAALAHVSGLYAVDRQISSCIQELIDVSNK